MVTSHHIVEPLLSSVSGFGWPLGGVDSSLLALYYLRIMIISDWDETRNWGSSVCQMRMVPLSHAGLAAQKPEGSVQEAIFKSRESSLTRIGLELEPGSMYIEIGNNNMIIT